MKNRPIKTYFAAILGLVALLMCQQAMAADWSVSYSGGNFVVTRTNSGGTATVLYRTASISALDGKHFTGVSGSLTFAPGETSKQVSVSENSFSSVPLRYRYQGTYKLYYDFEVTDQQGGLLARMRKTIYSGGDNNNVYYLNNIKSFVNAEFINNLVYFNGSSVTSGLGLHYHDETYTPPTSDVETSGTLEGYVYIDDSYDYTKKSATVSPGFLFAVNRAGASGEWHKLIGNKLYATVVFTEKEKDDGYAYVQILIGDGNTAYDTGADPNGEVNDPVKSIYKACFELKKGSGAYSGNGKWIFPHSSDAVNNDSQSFWMSSSYLWQQKFRSESYRATTSNAFVLDPDISGLTIRFDCGGSDDDTYGYKDLFVRWALLDATAPTVIQSDITVSPGLHVNGAPFTISVPFSEPVKFELQTRYVLHTTWGDLYADYDCRGSNVVSFSGTINASAGTKLTINSFEMVVAPGYNGANIIPIEDLMGIDFTGNISKSFNYTVEELYSISYNLAGGKVANANPTQYTSSSSSFTLENPTRQNYIFTGWTGTDLDGPTMSVTIPSGSSGNRSYTATWALNTSEYWTGDGSEGNPYVITTASGLDYLATLVNDGTSFVDTFFELGADIDLSGISPFKGIGTNNTDFRGKFDGKGHSVSNFTVNLDSQNNSGLFRNINGGYVRNVVVNNATISGKRGVAAVVGSSVGGARITNCSSINCTVSGDSNENNFVGAVVGYYYNGVITECLANGCTVNGNSSQRLYIGGIVGYFRSGGVTKSIVSSCTVNGTADDIAYIGTVTGFIYSANTSTSFAVNTTTNGTETIIGGTDNSGGTPTANHYHAITLTGASPSPVSDVFTVTACPGFTVNGTPTISYDGTDYFRQNAVITVSFVSSLTLSNIFYTPEGGSPAPATDNGNGTWNITMPESDITVYATEVLAVNALAATVMGETRYVTTFYDGTTDYMLPVGARAYTASLDGSTVLFHQIGLDGRVIPHGTAAIVVADSAALSLIKLASTDVTAYPGNILQGSDVAVAKPAGTVYVLNISGAVPGFYTFTGSTIPAGKAYYVVE